MITQIIANINFLLLRDNLEHTVLYLTGQFGNHVKISARFCCVCVCVLQSIGLWWATPGKTRDEITGFWQDKFYIVHILFRSCLNTSQITCSDFFMIFRFQIFIRYSINIQLIENQSMTISSNQISDKRNKNRSFLLFPPSGMDECCRFTSSIGL